MLKLRSERLFGKVIKWQYPSTRFLKSFNIIYIGSVWACQSSDWFSVHRIREITFINFFINRQTNFTIPPPGQYFQWSNLCCLGGIRTLQPSPDFHSQAFCQLNYKTSFCLEIIASPPHSTTPDYHGLPLWILKPREWAIIPSKFLQNLSHLGMCWIMMTVFVLSPVSTSYLILDSK